MALLKARVALALAVVAGLLVAQQLGVFHAFADPARLRQDLLALGGAGYLPFVASYALFQPFGVPGTIFVLVAPLVWPWPTAFALSMVGTMAASVVGFSFARFVARDWVTARIPPRFQRYDEALARRSFATVFVLRFVFWMPPLLHAFFGVSRVRFATHFWASLAGYAVPIFLVSYFGQRLFDFASAIPASVWLAGGGVVLAAAAAYGLIWWRGRTRVSENTGAPASP